MRPLLFLALACSFGAAALGACSSSDERPAPATQTPTRDAGRRQAEGPPRDTVAPLVLELGEVASGVDVPFEIPPNALGFQVLVEATDGPGSPAELGVESIESPSGERVHQAFTPAGGSHPTSRSVFGAIAAAGVPQGDSPAANPPQPGTWKVRFAGPPVAGADAGADGGAPSSPVRAWVRVQLGPPSGFAGGRLDLRVYVPEGLTILGQTKDAASAASDGEIGYRVDTFFNALYDLVGLDRGEVTFVPAPAALARVEGEAELFDAFALADTDAQVLHVVLTNAIELGDDAAWGIAPGIPGAALRPSTVMSSVVLAIGETPPEGDGLTLLHEAGHFFGLNHTTEFVGGYADPLSDTHECAGLQGDTPQSLFGCPDRFNLMFPAYYATAKTRVELSPGQLRVLRGSPVYRGYRDPLPAGGAMMRGPERAAPSAPRSLARSGRALTATEALVASTLCPHDRIDLAALARSPRAGALLADLRAAARDPELPRMMQRRAAALAEGIARAR